MSKTVAILGASSNPERYSYKALKKLIEYKHIPYPIGRNLSTIEENKVYSNIEELINLQIKIDTLTLYVNPKILETLKESIIKLKPNRIIFNPGSEDKSIMSECQNSGIECLEACTLVMLSTDQF